MAAFYVDTYADSPSIERFDVTQLVALGELADEPLLPSFCYLPAVNALPKGSIALPWEPEPEQTVGVLAREEGAKVPSRQIYSAKSWLAHAGIDRTQPILPWGSELEDRMMSPIAVTASYLAHIRAAWDHCFGKVKDADGSPCFLADQQTIITIPASFDETARELTLEAARQAGYKDLTLLEEPLSAFYAWLNRHGDQWKEVLKPGERVLVVDVGGGTTDFSFIEMDEDGSLRRFAVGDHLLLGGDNIDIALAREIEQEWGSKLEVGEWSMLVQHCRHAKEQILNEGAEKIDITLLARGSSVLQNVRRATLTREHLLNVLKEGFYPLPDRETPPPRKARGMRQMGLPYASEPAVTVHLLEFLRYAQRVTMRDETTDSLLYPDKVLFNGGSMKSDTARERVLAALASWFPEQPAPSELAGEDYSLAVAVGAAYYGRVRRGTGVKVRGGISRAYFIQAAAEQGEKRFVCVMSRDTDENEAVRVPGKYKLQTNEKVLFNLYSSSTRLHDVPGNMLRDDDELSPIAPLVSVLRYGKGDKATIDVHLATMLNEVGTLEVNVEAEATEHRWPLRFDLRAVRDAQPQETPEAVLVDTAKLEAAKAAIAVAFEEESERLPQLINELEELLDLPREQWALPILRELYDTLANLADERGRSPDHEVRWLNLAGWCLRPGFGDPADKLRMRSAWKMWFEGPAHARQTQAVAEWWVFWRRIAPGLKSGHHIAIDDSLEKVLIPRGKYRQHIREGDQAKHEMWRCLGALEQLPVKRKRRIGSVLLERLKKLSAQELWVLARLGSRHLFHAPVNHVLPARDASDWVRSLMKAKVASNTRKMRQFAVSMIATKTGDRNLDLPPDVISECKALLAGEDAPAAWRERLQQRQVESAEDAAQILGDSLPLGLSIVDLEEAE